jgi:hypothetical protein
MLGDARDNVRHGGGMGGVHAQAPGACPRCGGPVVATDVESDHRICACGCASRAITSTPASCASTASSPSSAEHQRFLLINKLSMVLV